MIFKRINEETRNVQARDAVKPSYITALLLYPSMQIRYFYKIACCLDKIHFSFFARLVLLIGRMITGIEINLGAKIGKRVFIDHGVGVVIGATAIIGDDVLIYHGVTLGANKAIAGRRHPKVGNNVVLGAGAKCIGAIEIGDNCQIGANAVVTKDIPANSTAVGIPAQVIKKNQSKQS